MSEDESQRPESDPQSWLVSTDNGIGEPTVSRAHAYTAGFHCTGQHALGAATVGFLPFYPLCFSVVQNGGDRKPQVKHCPEKHTVSRGACVCCL